ncbi:MAG: hypothetical protein DRO13_01290 [Thermoprotei archaeon]|nr:MAG: hypothetical protein DRO13_01290 [Thermoprotei archaeon]
MIFSNRLGKAILIPVFMTASLLLALVLPRVLSPTASAPIVELLGSISVEYSWYNDMLQINVTNRYHTTICLLKLVVLNSEMPLNNSCIAPGSSRVIDIEGVEVSRAVYARLYYSIEGREAYRIFVLMPPS